MSTMTSTTKPTLLFVPGSFSPARLYNDTIATITAAGYEVQAYDLPSTSTTLDKPAANMYDDADFFRSKAQAILECGQDVVLVSHSYGGVVASEALKGLCTAFNADSKQERPVVKGWVAIASLLLPVGVSLNVGTGGEKPDFVNIEACSPHSPHRPKNFHTPVLLPPRSVHS
jgi:alpha-beta hydrolase superfamily lysophospholipase